MKPFVGGCPFEESGYQDADGGYWKAETLYSAAKQQGVRKLKIPIEHLSWAQVRFSGVETTYDMAYHVRRALDCDLNKPILLGPLGNIMDGFHRLVMAIAVGKKFLWAYRLTELPDPDETKADKSKE